MITWEQAQPATLPSKAALEFSVGVKGAAVDVRVDLYRSPIVGGTNISAHAGGVTVQAWVRHTDDASVTESARKLASIAADTLTQWEA